MTYQTAVPVVRLKFSDGFKYYGAGTTVMASATVNLPVDQVRHRATGETLTDGALIPAQDITAFDVPATNGGWTTVDGSHISGWSYDLALTITATGKPPLLWTSTITPRGASEVITPGMGLVTGGEGGATVSVTESSPGVYTIGA